MTGHPGSSSPSPPKEALGDPEGSADTACDQWEGLLSHIGPPRAAGDRAMPSEEQRSVSPAVCPLPLFTALRTSRDGHFLCASLI